MRGKSSNLEMMFYAIRVEDRIRMDHPLLAIRLAVDEILRDLSPLFDTAYAKIGRPSVPPEVLLKALLLQCLYSIRSEKQLTALLTNGANRYGLAFPLVLRSGPGGSRLRCDCLHAQSLVFGALVWLLMESRLRSSMP